VRAARRLPPRLKREIRAFSFLYRHNLPNCFLPRPGRHAFEHELHRFRALDERTLAYELTRPLHDHGGREPYDPRLDAPVVRAAIRERGRRAGPDVAAVVDRLITDPVAVAARLAELLGAYWEAGFRTEWRRIEHSIVRAAGAGRRLSAGGGVYALLRALPSRLRVDPARHEFGVNLPHDHVVEIGPDGDLLLVPSLYVRPHVRVNCDRPWPLALIYPAAGDGRKRSPPPPDLVEALRALGDGTRLQVLRLIAERPRSPQELAPLIGISEAGLSKHLGRLVGAGLVRTRREGWYVVYSLEPARAKTIAEALQTYVGANED
jgi:DNA-binding transcriptional ArsR family regulator